MAEVPVSYVEFVTPVQNGSTSFNQDNYFFVIAIVTNTILCNCMSLYNLKPLTRCMLLGPGTNEARQTAN